MNELEELKAWAEGELAEVKLQIAASLYNREESDMLRAERNVFQEVLRKIERLRS